MAFSFIGRPFGLSSCRSSPTIALLARAKDCAVGIAGIIKTD